ncbi:glycosyltransferase family 2 protein [Cognatishimia sp. MH4019]|uniref:glycosyltransferase family 2 protein n=1 Tax=Cognatishimia sp. MH4019 TaxID=2854030 RepID=UPI001CD49466|nr:glycosyltransferase [Cognatishimia sp. MH4019]
MTQPTVSIVVVSRNRAALLKRCMMGLSQLLYQPYEIVVVADSAGLDALGEYPGQIKTVVFDAPNISAARNIGILHTSGEIIAFIDDDAVPEPTWLAELVKGFDPGDIAAVGGYVRGRNGISFQWKAGAVDQTGQRVEIDGPETPFMPEVASGQTAKLEGTNMAIRRDILVALGGFDPAFHYYLDETDLCLRLAHAGHAIAFAPRAEVHHGFAANATRSVSRAPTNLFQLGASKAVFLRKHANPAELEPLFSEYTQTQRRRLLSYLVHGMIEPRDVGRLLKTLRDGFEEGRNRAFAEHSPIAKPQTFLPFQTTASGGSVVLKGRVWQRGSLRQRARQLRDKGLIVTILLLDPSFRRHHVRFEAPGIWVQSGGLWGRSDRSQGPVLSKGFHGRIKQEIQRFSAQRALSDDDH